MSALHNIAIAVIPPGLQTPVGQLERRALRAARNELRETLLDTDVIAWSAFAFDFSLNDYTGQGGGLVWCPHFHGIAAVTDSEKLEAALQAKYRRTDEAQKPVWVTAYDTSTLGASYIFKTRFPRRSSYVDAGNRKRNQFLNTKCFKLRARPQIELALMLDLLGFDNRLLFINVKPYSLGFTGGRKKQRRSTLVRRVDREGSAM
jgi:hypothetical protein